MHESIKVHVDSDVNGCEKTVRCGYTDESGMRFVIRGSPVSNECSSNVRVAWLEADVRKTFAKNLFIL